MDRPRPIGVERQDDGHNATVAFWAAAYIQVYLLVKETHT
jgi:hypothetical protein